MAIRKPTKPRSRVVFSIDLAAEDNVPLQILQTAINEIKQQIDVIDTSSAFELRKALRNINTAGGGRIQAGFTGRGDKRCGLCGRSL